MLALVMASGLEHRDQEVGAGMGTVPSSEVAARAVADPKVEGERLPGGVWRDSRAAPRGKEKTELRWEGVSAQGWERRDRSPQLALQRYPGLSECT